MTDPRIHTRYCELFYSSGAAVSHADSREEIRVSSNRDRLDSICREEEATKLPDAAPRFTSLLWTQASMKVTGSNIAQAAVIKENPDPSQNKRVLIVSTSFVGESDKKSDRFDAIYIINDLATFIPGANLKDLSERMKALGIFPEELTLESHGQRAEDGKNEGSRILLSPSPLEKFVDENTDFSFFPSEKLRMIRCVACWMTRSLAKHIAQQWNFTGEFIFGSDGLNYFDREGKDLSGSRFPMIDLQNSFDLLLTSKQPFGVRQSIVFVNGLDVSEALALSPVLEDEKGLFTQNYRKTFEALKYTGWEREIKADLLNRLIRHLGPETDEIYLRIPKAVQLMKETNWDFTQARLSTAPHLILTAYLLEMSEKAQGKAEFLLADQYEKMACDLNPQNPSFSFASREMYLLSLDAWKAVLKENPKSVYATFALGITYKNLDQEEQARKWLEKANRMNPAHQDSLWALDALYSQEERAEDVIQLRRAWVEKNPSGESYYFLAEALKENCKVNESYLQESAHYYDLAMRENFNPAKSFTAIKQIAKLAEKKDKSRLEIFCYELLRSYEAKNVSVLTSLGWAYWRAGEFEKAQQCWEEGIEVSPDNETLLFYLSLANDPKINHIVSSTIAKVATWIEEL